jgi:hypothetical protein
MPLPDRLHIRAAGSIKSWETGFLDFSQQKMPGSHSASASTDSCLREIVNIIAGLKALKP